MKTISSSLENVNGKERPSMKGGRALFGDEAGERRVEV